MEQPSLFEAVVRFPGALIRLPSTAKDTLDALNALAERVDRLVTLLEQFEPGVNLAGAGVDVAASGITQAIIGLQQAVGTIDTALPGVSSSTAALRGLAERLGWSSIDVLPNVDAGDPDHDAQSDHDWRDDATTYSDPYVADASLDELTAVVGELVRIVATTVGTIPGVRQVLRVTTTAPSHRDGH